MLNTTITPKTLRTVLGILGVIVVVLFTLFQLRFYLGGPEIMLSTYYYETEEPFIDLVFKVANTKELLVQGVVVVPQVSGRVERRVFVQSGLNTVTLEVTDTYGARKTQKIYVFYPQVLEKQD